MNDLTTSLHRLRALVGDATIVTDPERTAPMLRDHRALYRGHALAVVAPPDVETVSRVLAFCNENHIGVVPQGGNTSYCGGATPDATSSQVLLSLARLDRVRAIDAANYTMTAEAGCVLAHLQAAAAEADRYLPLSLGSEGSCMLGGNLSTNAGGLNVIHYGMARELVLGLEVVLADGRVMDTLTGLRKDNTGYDIKSLFLGAEGTLGVITAACIKLYPSLKSRATAFVAVRDPDAAVSLLGALRQASGDCVTSFELIPRVGVELTTRHIPGVVDPLSAPSAWYVLCELSTARAAEPFDALLQDALEQALGQGWVSDAAVAQNERERETFWRLRESIPEAQRKDGASLKHDVSVPVSQVPRFIEVAGGWVDRFIPQGVLVAYGHLGDGNLHFNINQRQGTQIAQLQAVEQKVKRAIHDFVKEFGGSFSAEHGIGQLKVFELERYANPVELDLMRRVKQAFDPNGIMNPGKVLRRQEMGTVPNS
ncbi:MAG TPA: FAD-binding oxidoreductase [Steroidobacteraceae bacterium]|nr:FAD-binding oxidoreductase [Steroidobacteraceae bacterium]